MKKIALCSAFVFIFGCAFVQAERGVEEPATIETADCRDSQTLDDMNRCRAEAHEQARLSMGLAVKSLTESLAENEPRLLPYFERAQDAWYQYARSECAQMTYYSKGTQAFDAEFSMCMEVKFLRRLDNIKHKLRTP